MKALYVLCDGGRAQVTGKVLRREMKRYKRPHYFFTWCIIKLHNFVTFEEETLLLPLENHFFPLNTERTIFSRSFHAHEAEVFFLFPQKMFYREERTMSIFKLAGGLEEEKIRHHPGILGKYVSQISCQEIAVLSLKKFF